MPTLLFLPGTLCDERLWAAQIETLSIDWPVAVADYRYETSIASMAEHALAAVKASSHDVIPIGLSMGGMVALEIWRCSRNRVAAMALFDTDAAADTPARRKNRDAQIVDATHGDFARVVAQQLKPAYFSTTAPVNHAAAATALAMALAHGVGAFACQITAIAMRADATLTLASIDVPVLVACGAEDRICSPAAHRKMASQLAHATFIEIANAGHLPPLEQPLATTQALQIWLGGLDSQPRRS